MNAKKLLAGAALSLAAAGSQALTLGDVLQGSAYYQSKWDSVYDTGSSYVRLTDTDGTADSASAYLLLELAGNLDSNTFGIFDVDTEGTLHTLEIFNGLASPSDVLTNTATISFTGGQAHFNSESMYTSGAFGFYIGTGSGNFYSDPTKNGDIDYAAIFNTNKEATGFDTGPAGADVVVAFEDIYGLGDKDFNDLVVGITDVTPVPVPAGVLLLGAGVAGLGALRKKLSAKPEGELALA